MISLIQKIKEKKSLSNLEDLYIQFFIDNFLNRNDNLKLKNKYLENNLKQREFEIIVKNIRNELNKTYGQFWLDNSSNLESHKSSKERINNYSKIYDEIFKTTGKPKVLFDISAGLNPLSYNLISKNTYFIASELTEKDCKILENHFKKENIKGEVIKLDLLNYDPNSLPQSDVCFIFKTLDIFDDYKLAEKLITSLKTKYIVVSFAIITVKNKKMNHPRRGWLERMLERLNYSYTKFSTDNEIFYIIKKQ